MSTVNNMPPRWTTDVENWTEIGKDAAAFMHASAERALSETVATAEGITKRADRLLTITLALFAAALGHLLYEANQPGVNTLLTDAAKLSLLPLTVAMFFILRNLFPYRILVPGAMPEEMLVKERFDKELSPELQYLDLALDQIECHQRSIEKNDTSNLRRVKNNLYAQYALITLPICLFLVYLVNL